MHHWRDDKYAKTQIMARAANGYPLSITHYTEPQCCSDGTPTGGAHYVLRGFDYSGHFEIGYTNPEQARKGFDRSLAAIAASVESENEHNARHGI